MSASSAWSAGLLRRPLPTTCRPAPTPRQAPSQQPDPDGPLRPRPQHCLATRAPASTEPQPSHRFKIPRLRTPRIPGQPLRIDPGRPLTHQVQNVERSRRSVELVGLILRRLQLPARHHRYFCTGRCRRPTPVVERLCAALCRQYWRQTSDGTYFAEPHGAGKSWSNASTACDCMLGRTWL
jgi:hypothetical protein